MADAVPLSYSSHPEVKQTTNNHRDDAAFTSSSVQLEVGEQKVKLRMLRLHGATMLFVCQPESEFVDELGVALPPKQVGGTSIVSSTTLLGSEFASKSQRLAEKLSKRYGRQFFISYNIPTDNVTGPLLDRQICEYVHANETAT